MDWQDLLFLHWPVKVEALRRFVPRGLEIESFGGTAWIGVIPFTVGGFRIRHTPRIPLFSTFCEINVRTYVTDGSKPGIYFLSLDAHSRLAVMGARRRFHLPYHLARISCRHEAGEVFFKSQRRGRGGCEPCFEATYRPLGRAFEAKGGTLEHFLTERYCLYTTGPNHSLMRGEVHHQPWPLKRVDARLGINSMADPFEIQLPDVKPLALCSAKIEAVAWSLEPVQAAHRRESARPCFATARG